MEAVPLKRGPLISDLPGGLVRPQAPKTFLTAFTWERYKKRPESYRKRISSVVDEELLHVDAATALMHELRPVLRRLVRQLGFLNVKCGTLYERYCFIRQLRHHAEKILRNFDLFIGTSVEDAVSEAPPLLKSAVQMYQTRWRNAIASSKWQKDADEAERELRNLRIRSENMERDLELKRHQLEMYKRIHAVRHEFEGLSDEDKLKKVESILGVTAPRPPAEEEGAHRKRSLSDSSVTSVSSDDSIWGETWLDEAVSRR